jgi:hypothetical protein
MPTLKKVNVDTSQVEPIIMSKSVKPKRKLTKQTNCWSGCVDNSKLVDMEYKRNVKIFFMK